MNPAGRPARPEFLIVCDHGNKGGDMDPVARLPWFIDRPGWWTAGDADGLGARVWPMQGDHSGWDTDVLTSGDPQRGPGRFAIEVECTAKGCTEWKFRSDEDQLQALFELLATDERFRPLFVHVDSSRIVMKLRDLRDTADRWARSRRGSC